MGIIIGKIILLCIGLFYTPPLIAATVTNSLVSDSMWYQRLITWTLAWTGFYALHLF